MNLLHLKYAVEVEKTKSISKAAENLYMGQPNLSRAIKELEDSLGVIIFERTPRGILVTPDGEVFLRHAKRILSEVDDVERIYREGKTKRQKFSASVPRSSYISLAFANFSKSINKDEPADIYFRETNSVNTVNGVIREEFDLGIVRYQPEFDRYFKDLFENKRLVCESITDFSCTLLVSVDSPLANGKLPLTESSLTNLIEVAHSDPYVPSVSVAELRRAELTENVDRHIFVFDRANQFEILRANPETFMWVSPVPDDVCEKFGLVQLHPAPGMKKIYRDVLIYREDYRLSELDNSFITELCMSKRKYIG